MIELIFERTWLQIKGMKAMFAIPFVGYYVLIPLGVWAMSYSVDFVLSDAIAQMCYLLVPFLSTWWIYLMAKEFVEGSGREVLLSSSGGLINMLIYEFINMLCVIPLFYVRVSYIFYPDVLYLIEQLLIISFFMGGLAYCLCYLLKNITVAMFVIVLYSLISNYHFSNERFISVLGKIQLINLQQVPYEENNNLYFTYILLGCVCWTIGTLKAKRI